MHSRRSIGGIISSQVWLCACLAMAAIGFAGCGGGGGTATSTGATGPTSTASAAGASAEDVYQACLGALEGAVAQKTANNSCAQVRDAFQQCVTAASNAPEGSARDAALKACRQEADKATSQLQGSP